MFKHYEFAFIVLNHSRKIISESYTHSPAKICIRSTKKAEMQTHKV